VRRDVAASGSILREKMGQFVTQSTLDLGRRDFDQLGIQGDRLGVPAGEAGRRPQPWSPHDGHLELRAAGGAEKLSAQFLKKNITVEAARRSRRVGAGGVRKESQVAKNGFSEIERNKLSEFHQAAMGCAWRSTTLVRAPRQCSISVSAVWLPREKRTVDEASSGATPMARRTCEG